MKQAIKGQSTPPSTQWTQVKGLSWQGLGDVLCLAFRPARVHTRWETECAMQPPDPIATDRLKSPQEAAPSAPRGTIAPVIFRGLLAAGMTLWVAFVLCDLSLIVQINWHIPGDHELYKYRTFFLQTALKICLVVLPLTLAFYTGDFSDHPELYRRARLLLTLFVFLGAVHTFLYEVLGHY